MGNPRLEQKAVDFLREYGASTPSEVGVYLWGQLRLARPAQALLERLARAGRVRRLVDEQRPLYVAADAPVPLTE